MDDFNQKRAADDLDLYRYDGRSFQIDEENGVLILNLRRSILVERLIVSVLILCFLGSIWMILAWKLRYLIAFIDGEGHLLLEMVGAIFVALPLGLVGTSITMLKTGELWTFNKSVAKVRCNQVNITDFSKIRGVRAWRRGSRFYLGLEFKYGHTVKLGKFAFSRSEHAWRQDAAQIAAFLGVPLEIPPL